MTMVKRLGVALAIALIPMVAASADDGGARSGPRERRSAVPVPEPTDLALFAAGIAGLIIGRRGSRSRRRDD